MSASGDAAPLQGARVLLVEDEFLIGLAVSATLTEAGAEVIGPATTVAEALRMAGEETLTAAVLDIRLGRETVEPVAERLDGRGVPFLFYTGQSPTRRIEAQWPDVPVLSKPTTNRMLTTAVARLMHRAAA